MGKEIAGFIAGFRKFQQKYFCAESDLFEELRSGQAPKACVVACCDSRADPALLMRAAPGDIFVVRNVANIVPPYEPDGLHHGVSAAIEFAVRDLCVEHVIVMGHGHCGGIHALMNAARDDVSEFIGHWMDIVRPAYARVSEAMPNAEPGVRQRACEQAAVLVSLENLLTFPWLRDAVEAGRCHLHGWYFDIERGELLSYLPETGAFEPLVPLCEKAPD